MKTSIRIFLLILPIIFLLTVSFVLVRYNIWRNTFEKSIDRNNLVSSPYTSDGSLEKKVAQFTLSEKDTEVLQLSPSEFSGLILVSSNQYSRVYIEPDTGVWKVYAEIVYKGIPVWLGVDLNKDSMQTAQLYITDVNIGPYSVGKLFSLTDKVNTGIANALLTVNENGFTGRYLENIELLKDGIVVKGSRY